jgi:TRAP-type mannitol/chloroaromatic compound transport system permease large subunit
MVYYVLLYMSLNACTNVALSREKYQLKKFFAFSVLSGVARVIYSIPFTHYK